MKITSYNRGGGGGNSLRILRYSYWVDFWMSTDNYAANHVCSDSRIGERTAHCIVD